MSAADVLLTIVGSLSGLLTFAVLRLHVRVTRLEERLAARNHYGKD